MALRWLDSFDHYATADLLKKYTSSSSTPTISTGRFTNGLNLDDVDLLNLTLDSQATWIMGFAFNLVALSGTRTMVRFLDGTTQHVELYFGADGRMFFTRNGTGIGSSSTQVFTAGIWYYVEVKVTISDGAGVAVLRVNGVDDINLSGIDTRNGANASSNVFSWGATSGGGAPTWRMDDLYICDDTGGVNDDFLGDTRVECIVPNGNGNSSVLVGSDGNSTDNYLLVDETTSPSDADYVESSTPGDKDTYAYGNVTPTTGTVHGVQIVPRAAKTDAGVRNIASVARLSGTEVDSADKLLSTTYVYLPDIRETKPGGGAWSISDVNSAEFGVKVTA